MLVVSLINNSFFFLTFFYFIHEATKEASNFLFFFFPFYFPFFISPLTYLSFLCIDGHTTDDLKIIWDYIRWPTTISPTLDVPEFKLIDVTNHNCISETSTGNFSCLEAILYFQRKMEYYLIQVYLPSCLVVVLSWLSFWIDIEAVPARISLGLLTVLTMSTQNSDFASQMPRLSYVKAVDVWMVMCLVFVFGALLEYALVNILARKQKPKQDKFLSALVRQATVRHVYNINKRKNLIHFFPLILYH